MALKVCLQQPQLEESQLLFDSSLQAAAHDCQPDHVDDFLSRQYINQLLHKQCLLINKSNIASLIQAVTCKMSTSNISGETVFLSGGLQQYLIKNQVSLSVENGQPRKGFGSDSVTFHDLSDGIQLHLFSFLDAENLCTVASVCKHWLLLASDNLLWKRRLEQDIKTWNVIGHSTNPDMYEECDADVTSKDIYLRCSPIVKERLQLTDSIGVHKLTQYVATTVRSFLPRKIPKLAMFGPGLESSTSSIVKEIIEGHARNIIFKATGMFPGQFGGIGSGFTIQMNNSSTFNLITLYTSTWEERHNKPFSERLKINKLLVHHKESEMETDNDDEIFQVNPSIKELCRTLDGFVFVIDANNKDAAAMNVARSELYSMVNDSWCAPTAPLIVLSCLMKEDKHEVSCIDVVRHLKLSKLNRPWQVHDCRVDSLSGIPAAFEWIIERAQRK